MDKEKLLQMISEDDDGILSFKPKVLPISSDSRLIDSFQEINSFFREHKRRPEKNHDIFERKLAINLDEIQKSDEKIKLLKKHDKYNLLPVTTKKMSSINDIFDDDDLWILEEAADIFNLKYVKVPERNETDYIARRRPCKNFEKYKEKFILCHDDINIWRREINSFISEDSIQPKMFYILDGVMLYIESIWKVHIDKNHKKDGRLHCIFENWTESTMLLRSLGKAMRINRWGRVISQPLDESIDRLKWITSEDEKSWYIYVLKYKWTDKNILDIPNFYKVWFSTLDPIERIKNSEKEATFLFSPVHLYMKVQCYNMNPQKFENAIHTLLWEYRMNIDVFDDKKKRYTPREWFSVPFDIIEEAIDTLITE